VIGLGPIGVRRHGRQQGLEENDYKYTKALKDTSEQVPRPTQPPRILLDMQ
jgi:hypothetical protein